MFSLELNGLVLSLVDLRLPENHSNNAQYIERDCRSKSKLLFIFWTAPMYAKLSGTLPDTPALQVMRTILLPEF